MNIAIYGYGEYGKGRSKALKLYWGGEHTVTAIFDRKAEGFDAYWQLPVESPSELVGKFRKGIFEAVYVCIANPDSYGSVKEFLCENDVPLFSAGHPEDLVPASEFGEQCEPPIDLGVDGYKLYVFKSAMLTKPISRGLGYWLVFDSEGKILDEYYSKYIDSNMRFYEYIPFRLKEAVVEKIFYPGEYCNLVKLYDLNYWHFTTQCMDCVALLENAGFKGKYIVRDQSFRHELLALFGIGPERILDITSMPSQAVCVFEYLYCPEPESTKYNNEANAKAIVSFSNKMTAGLSRDQSSTGKLLYIERIGMRRLLNGAEFAKKHGFEVYIPDGHTVTEQIKAFYNADIILCPHGANSTNCIYMRPGTVFIELFSKQWNFDINSGFLKEKGVVHIKASGPAVEPGPTFAERIKNDYIISEEILLEKLLEGEQIINNRTSATNE